MAAYVCRFGTPGGAIRTETREADSARSLRQELERRGCYVLGISPAPSLRLQRPRLLAPLVRRVALKDVLIFNQEFHALVRAGLPITHCLDALVRRCTNPRLRGALVEICKDVKSGLPFSEAAARHPGLFSHLYVASLRAGEKSGAFAEALGRHIALLKRVLAVRKRVRSALTYPAVLLLLSSAVVAFLLAYVVPIFVQIYASFEALLPLPTLILIQLAELLKVYVAPLLGLLAVAGAGLQRWLRTRSGRRRIDRLLLGLPWLDEVLRWYSASLFCRTLATLLAGGIPIIASLETAADSVPNSAVRERLRAAVPAVGAGSSLAAALEGTATIPATALEMIAVGESTGSLPEMLGHVADFFDEDLDVRLQSLTAVVEPLIMVAMGLFVGTIVVVMYLPIFDLAGTIR